MRNSVLSWLFGTIVWSALAAPLRADEPILTNDAAANGFDPGLYQAQAPPSGPGRTGALPPRPVPAPIQPATPAPGSAPAPTARSALPAAGGAPAAAPVPVPVPVGTTPGTPYASAIEPGTTGLSALTGQPPLFPPGMFGGPPQGGTELAGLSQSGIPQMIGDSGPNITLRQTSSLPQPFPPPTPPRPPSPRKASAFAPSVRGLKISENQSPRPQDRFFFTFDYFSNVNGPLNLRLGAPVKDIRVYRYIFGWEQTFDNGNASIGVRLPLDQLTANPATRARFKQIGGTSTALDDMDVYLKYILKQDPKTGSLISVGMEVTPTTGGGNFAGAKYIDYINTTLFQPFVGYIWNPGKFYLQGFSAFEFPVNPTQVTEMYNDVGMGYFVYRTSSPTEFLTAVVPTFEVHVNSPLNHRDFDDPNEIAGTAASVNLTYGLNLEFGHNSLLTLGFVNPVTGPQPFNFEALVLFNYRFGRSARRALPPVISG